MNWKDRLISFFSNLKVGIIISYYILAGYGLLIMINWAIDSDPVINLPLGSIDKIKTFPGDVVVFKQPIQKFRDCPGEVNRFISGDCGLLHLPQSRATLNIGDHVLTIPVEIPLSFQKGSCEFVSKFIYFCNPVDYIFQRKIYSSFPIQFTVGERP